MPPRSRRVCHPPPGAGSQTPREHMFCVTRRRARGPRPRASTCFVSPAAGHGVPDLTFTDIFFVP